MISSTGQKLRQTREKRGISIDEAAHATKLRPDQIAALEVGDYAAFPSNSYARGFLKIYGRYLKVDVSSEAASLDTSNRISIDDYQYLSIPNEPPPEPERNLPDLSLARRKKPSLLPLLASAGLIVVGFFTFTTYLNWQRITGDLPQKQAALEEETSAEPKKDAAEVATTPEPVAATPEPASTSPSDAPATPPATAPVAEAGAVAAATPQRPAGVMDVDRQFLGEPTVTARGTAPVEKLPPVADPDRDVIAPVPVAVNEVEVSVAKKTWVTIRREEHDAVPVFEDYLYPGVRPLKLKGTRFIIEAREPGVVEIRKNGAPIAYQRPGVTVQ